MFKKITFLAFGCLLAAYALAADPFAEGGWGGDDDMKMEGPEAKPGKVIRIQRSTQKSDINTFVTKSYRLKNANPIEVFPYVNSIVSLENGSAATNVGGPVKYLIVTCPEFQLPYIDKVVEGLDHKDMTYIYDDNLTVYRAKNRLASNLQTTLHNSLILDNIYGTGGGSIFYDPDLNALIVATVNSIDETKLRGIIEPLDVAPPQMAFNVQLVEVEMNDGGTLGIDWDAWKGLVAGAITYERNHASSRGRGDAMASDRAGSLSTNMADVANWNLGKNWGASSVQAVSGGEGWGAVLSIDAVAAAHFLNYMVGKNKGSVLTETKITVPTGQSAVVDATMRIPYYVYTGEISNPSGSTWTNGDAINRNVRVENEAVGGNRANPTAIDGPATTVNKMPAVATPVVENQVAAEWIGVPPAVAGHALRVKIAQEGVVMRVNPVIGKNSATAHLSMEVHSMLGWSNLNTPIINSRRIESRINVENGKLFSFGGLTKTNNINEETGIPFLGEIPFLGLLFKKETKIKKNTFVVALVLPQIRNIDKPADEEDLRVLQEVEQQNDRSIVYGKGCLGK